MHKTKRTGNESNLWKYLVVSGKYILETLTLGIKIGIGFPKSASGARRGSRANVSIISRGFWVCTQGKFTTSELQILVRQIEPWDGGH